MPKALFSKRTKDQIRGTYQNHCGICLKKVPRGHCAHLLDASEAGAKQLSFGVYMGLIQDGYKRSSAENGIFQCPDCHTEYFTPGLVALSPPPQILKHIWKYLAQTETQKLQPLHQVIRSIEARKTLLPYVGLCTLVSLLPEDLDGHNIKCIKAGHQPDLSVVSGRNFISAPQSTMPGAKDTARIFDVLQVPDDPPETSYAIPLSPRHTEYLHHRYWRLPTGVEPGVLLVSLIKWIPLLTHSTSKEIEYAHRIYIELRNIKAGISLIGGRIDRKRTAEDRHDDRPRKKLSSDKTRKKSVLEKGNSGGKGKARLKI